MQWKCKKERFLVNFLSLQTGIYICFFITS
nr:MAG TPA: hypothetical protein [Caudoviricetes sp.]DAY36278.1 MAG TPA: hypothetical protein [Caudoviricetes sp.]